MTPTLTEYLDTLPESQPSRLAAHVNNYYTVSEGTRAGDLLDLLALRVTDDLVDEAEDLILADAAGDLEAA